MFKLFIVVSVSIFYLMRESFLICHHNFFSFYELRLTAILKIIFCFLGRVFFMGGMF